MALIDEHKNNNVWRDNHYYIAIFDGYFFCIGKSLEMPFFVLRKTSELSQLRLQIVPAFDTNRPQWWSIRWPPWWQYLRQYMSHRKNPGNTKYCIGRTLVYGNWWTWFKAHGKRWDLSKLAIPLFKVMSLYFSNIRISDTQIGRWFLWIIYIYDHLSKIVV